MASNEAILPYLERQKRLIRLPLEEKPKLNGIEKLNLEKRGSYFPPLCSSGGSDVDESNQKLSPLVKRQIQRSICSAEELSPRQQEAKVSEWLHRNRIRVTRRLPRLDPLTLTSRGVNVEKYMNFIYPPPLCIKIKNPPRLRQRRLSYEEMLREPKEPCPRLLRTLRQYKDPVFLNPVIRVGGGYKRLTWKTAEVLPAIGEHPNDVTSAFTCITCGVNLAVKQEIMDNEQGVMRIIVTYPSNCANCGKDVNTRKYNLLETGLHAKHESVKETIYRGNSSHVIDHRQLKEQRHKQQFAPNRDYPGAEDFDSNVDWRNDMESFREHMSRAGSEFDNSIYSDDADYSNTPHCRDIDDGIFITEPGISMKRLEKPSTAPLTEVRHAWDDGVSDLAEVTRGYDSDTHESRAGVLIVEDRDPESGIKVKVRRKAGKSNGPDPVDHTSSNTLDHEPRAFSGSHNSKRSRKYSESGKQERRNHRSRNVEGSRHDKSTMVENTRDVGGDGAEDIDVLTQNEFSSEETINDYENFTSGFNNYNEQRSRPYYYQRNAKSDGELHESERWYMSKTNRHIWSRRRTYPRSHCRFHSSSDENSISEEEFNEEWQRTISTRLSSRNAHSSSFVEMKKRSAGRARAYYDGYLADSEEDGLKKLQAQLKRMHRESRKHSSGKDEKKGERSKTQIRDQNNPQMESEKEDSKSKATGSLAMYGLESDSWDSDGSLHVRPFGDEDFSSDESDKPIYLRKSRPATVNECELPSHRAKREVAIAIKRRSLGGSNVPNVDDFMAEREHNFEIEVGIVESQPALGETETKKHRYVARKYPNRTAKPGPLKPRGGPVRYKAQFDDEDLSEGDIHFFTAQMQKAFDPNIPKAERDNEELYCKGQSCFRCGTFIDECEGSCTACGTHCKRAGAPCAACRDNCQRCGKTRGRCESRVERLGTSDEPEVNGDLCAEGRGIEIENAGNSEETHEQGEGGTSLVDGSIQDEQEIVKIDTNADNRMKPPKKKRNPTVKKRKKSGSHARRPTRHRTSTMDSEKAGNEQEEIQEESEIEENHVEDDVSEEKHEEEEDTRPQPSKHTKATRKSKPSKQVVSQIVIYKNSPKKRLSRGESMDRESTGIEREREELEEEPETGDELEGNEKATEGLDEMPPQEDREANQECTKDSSRQEEKIVQKKESVLKTETKVEEQPKKEEKPKPQELRGIHRVNAAFKDRVDLNKRLQKVLKEALNNVIAEADIKVRRDSTIDYLAQYRLVDRSKVEVYGRAFTLEDENENGILSYEQMLLALEGVPTICGMSRQQLNYVLQVLEITPISRVSFKMFAVITALCERVSSLDALVKELVEGLDLTQTEWKVNMYKEMFYVTGDRSVTFITPDNLRIELKAGGLNQSQEDHVIKHITQSTKDGQISFLDYMAYLPLFLSIHKNICNNALDMSRDKYARRK